MSARKALSVASETDQATPEPPEVVALNGAKFGPVHASGVLKGVSLTEPSTGNRRMALLPGGEVVDVIPEANRSARRHTTPTISRTEDTMAGAILAQPEAYRLFDLPTKDYLAELNQTIESQRGRPRKFPPALFSAIAALRKPLGPTLEATMGKIATSPGMIETIWNGVAAHGTYPLTESQLAAKEANLLPHRSTVARVIHHRYSIEDLSQAFAEIAVKAVLELGYFTGGNLADLHNHLHTDGSVLMSPSKARTAKAIDLKTGKVRNQRLDPARGYFHEAGGTPAVGAKYT
jgi:hypothetical protein